jgi:hypothetical protein
MTDNAAGWQPDPTGRFEHRYWDGSQWTDNVANAGVASTDAYAAAAAGIGAAGLDETVATNAPAGDVPGGDVTEVTPTPDAPADAAWAAPTIAQPAAPGSPTAAWPATPASPPPPSYTPPSGPPPTVSPTGSKRGLLIGGGMLAVVVLAIVAVLALGGGDDDNDEDRTAMISGLRDSGLSDSEAECLADGLIDEVGADELKGEDFSDQPDAVSDDVLQAELEDCDIDEQALGGDSEDDGVLDGTETPEGFEDMLSGVYEDMGIPADKAQCLADRIAESVGSGELSEEAAMSDFLSFFEDCDIDPSEITGN